MAGDTTGETETTGQGPAAGVGVQRRSLWLQEALVAETGGDAPTLRGTLDTDTCIVGGGYTGLWTALRIKELEPGARVTVLEADICGGAASGRNGGFALTWWPKLETLVDLFGPEEGLRLAHASEWAVNQLGAFCMANNVDAHFLQRGWIWTASSPAQVESWAGALTMCETLGVQPFQRLSTRQVQERTGSPANLAGVFEPCCATVQPAVLARGMRRVAMDRGVQIFEHSPMVSFDRQTGIARTPHGAVRAATIVLATNAFAARVRDLRRAIEPLGSDMVATEPIPDTLRHIGWTGGESISNSRLMVHYYRTTRDGRIAFGRGGGALGLAGRIGPGFDHSTSRAQTIAADLRRLVPGAASARITHEWAGAVDRTPDGLPMFGRLRGRVPVLFGIGFSGNGVAPTYLGGQILASSALGRQDEWSRSPLNRGVRSLFPPEPFRYVGGLLVRGAVQRKETREDAGLTVDIATRCLAALAPSA